MTPGLMSTAATAIVLGTALGAGVWCLVSLAPRWRAVTLARRIAPYVRDVTDPRGTAPWPGGISGATSVEALWVAARSRLSALLGGSESVSRRLAQAGRAGDVAAFRGRQLVWALSGVAVGGAVVVSLALAGRFSPATALVPPLLAAFGLALCDLRLSAAARARVARIQEELPTVLEFLALCLSAGESLLDSLRRVSTAAAGELTGELRTVVLAVGTGSPLAESLGSMAARVQLPALTRTVDHLVAAIDRGAPLAQVLQSQATDAREDAKRGLIEKAGRKEIQMLVPLVFLILPLSVVFAVFPGIFMLRLGVG